MASYSITRCDRCGRENRIRNRTSDPQPDWDGVERMGIELRPPGSRHYEDDVETVEISELCADCYEAFRTLVSDFLASG